MLRLLPLVVVLALLGCPSSSGSDGGPDGGAAPVVTSIAPDRGPAAGGTLVTVNGSGLANGATVVFGTAVGTQVIVASSRKLTVVAPAAAAPGKVSVRVTNPDGQSAALADAFTYEAGGGKTIDEALVLNALDAADESGAAMVTVNVKGQVSVPTVTNGAGQGPGVRAQVGFAPDSADPMPGDFTWVEASYTGDVDGTTPGDLARDAYAADVTLTGASMMQEKRYALAARFSVDNGVTWVFADHDGSANGVTSAQVPRVRVSLPVADWCKLGGEVVTAPPMLSLRVGDPAPVIYAQVYEPGVTDQVGVGAGLVAQLGHGDMAAAPDTWAWANATFNRDTGAGANDEYQATLPLTVGTERFAYRVSLGSGPWRYCDADGLATGGFTVDQTGQLTVRPLGIDECRLQFPLTLSSLQGQPVGPVYGRVTGIGVTDSAGAGPGIEAQLGYGPAASPLAAWTWANASYNLEVPSGGGAEEWQASFTGPAAGAYLYGYRFRYQGSAWVYCDADPSDNMVTTAQMGVLTASAFAPTITACKLQYVDQTAVGSGEAVTAYGRAVVPGLSADAGATPGLRGQVGVGSAGDNASSSASWGWREARFNVDIPDAGADEFVANFNPAYSGTRAVSFRFSLNDGGSWSYCDLNGSEVNGYEVAQQHSLNVGNAVGVDYCALKFPATITQDAGLSTQVYGQIYVAGVTPMAGADPSIKAQLGYGLKVQDPGVSSGWTWAAASYNSGCTTCGANNDEYVSNFSAPSGTWSYAYRFSRNDGGTWCFADLDGTGTSMGFNGEAGSNDNLGAATVK